MFKVVLYFIFIQSYCWKQDLFTGLNEIKLQKKHKEGDFVSLWKFTLEKSRLSFDNITIDYRSQSDWKSSGVFDEIFQQTNKREWL